MRRMRVAGFIWTFFLTVFVCLEARGQVLLPELRAEGVWSNGWFRLGVKTPTNRVYVVERSGDLKTWKQVAVLHGPEFEEVESLSFVDPSGVEAGGYYRVMSRGMTFNDDWRNQVYHPNDAFRSDPISFGPETRWIKFAIKTNEPARVYYQNSWKYPFHYDYAVARLPEFAGMSAAQFDGVSLHTNGQKVVLGTVLFAPRVETREAAVQFVGMEAYSAEQIAEWFAVVRSTVLPLDELKVFYMPTFEQTAVAESNRGFFASRGIEVSNLAAWDTGQNC